MIHILENGLISVKQKNIKNKFLLFAFGDEFMESNDKGDRKLYKEDK